MPMTAQVVSHHLPELPANDLGRFDRLVRADEEPK
jgi:hypothetical protein